MVHSPVAQRKSPQSHSRNQDIPMFEQLESRLLLSADIPGLLITVPAVDTSYEQAIEIDHDNQQEETGWDEIATIQAIETLSTEELVASETVPAQQLEIPDLPGLQLVDPDICAWNGQIIYLDFDGQENATYDGPVNVGPFDVPAFQASGDSAGREQEIINQVLAELEQTFAGTGIIFTTSRPAQGIEYSTIYIGGDDSVFTGFGSFNGLAEQVDVGNMSRCDEAFVFSDGLSAEKIISIIHHELGHLLGYEHVEQAGDTAGQSLTDVAEVSVTLENVVTELPEDTDTSSRIKVADIVITDDASGTNNLSLSGLDSALFEIDPVVIVGSGSTALYLKAGASLDNVADIGAYLSDPSCVAYWQFENGAFGRDSVGTNHLSIYGPTINTSDFIEGNSSAEFSESSDRFSCSDSNLDPDFPLKSDGTYKDITTVQWVKFNDLGPEGHYNEIFAKYKEDNVSYRLEVNYDGRVRISIGYADPFQQEHDWFPTSIVTDRWYFIASTYEYSTRSYRVQIYDYAADDFLDNDLVGSFDHDVIVGDGNLLLGYPSDLFSFNGLMDACIVFNRVLSVEELNGIRLGMYRGENSALEVTVEVDDADAAVSPDDTASLSIMVTDVNDPPTVALANTITTLSENTDTTSRIKVADIVIMDDSLGTNVLSLSGADASLFEIDGTELYLIAGASLDFEINPTLDVTVQVNDVEVGTTPDDTASLSIAIVDGNDAPVLAAIGNRSVDEGSLLTFTAGATDIDVPTVLTFSLDPGAPVGASIDPVTGVFTWTPGEDQGPGEYSITIRVTDNGTPNLNDHETIIVTVNEVNAGPVLDTNIGITVDEGGTGIINNTELRVTDEDLPAQTLTFTIRTNVAHGILYKSGVGLGINDTFTQADIDAGNISYEHDGSDTTSDSFRFSVSDGDDGNIGNTTFDITITPVNDAPVLSATEGTPLSYSNFGNPEAITDTIIITDIDDTTLEGAIVSISSGYVNGEDTLSFTNQLGITGNWNPATGVLTLSGTSSLANYRTALRSVSYTNSSVDPDVTVRTVSFMVNDGVTDSNIITRDIIFTEGEIELDAKGKAQFYDADGDLVTVALKGDGTGTIHFAHYGPCDIDHIELTGTTVKSSLVIMTKGSTTIRDINTNGSLRSITAKTTDLLGNISADGWIGSILMDDVAGDHVITIGVSVRSKPVTMKFDQVADLIIVSETPLKSFTASEWLGGSLTTPWITNLSIRDGDFSADVILGADTRGFALKKLTVAGKIIDSNVIAENGSIGTITVGALWNSVFVCTAVSNSQVITLSDLEDDIVPGSRLEIKKLTIKGIKNDNSNFFINSNIAAANLGTISLLFPQYDNSGVPFGLVADFIKKVNIIDNVGSTSFKNLNSPGDSIQDLDYEICLV